MKPSDNFYISQEEPIKSCLLAMRSILLESDPNVSETKKYGMPCFCFYNKMFCYLWIDKKTNNPYYLFVEGKHLKHPMLKSEVRKRMKVLHINPHKNLQVVMIRNIITQALDLYKSGVIKIK